MIKCPKCGADNTDGSKFCQGCAFELSSNNTQNSAKIIITRKSQLVGSAQSYDVYLYNNYC